MAAWFRKHFGMREYTLSEEDYAWLLANPEKFGDWVTGMTVTGWPNKAEE